MACKMHNARHGCFPEPAHESRGDRSLISDAKSQELRAAAGTTSAPASTWEEAIKHRGRAGNAKCLQLGGRPRAPWQQGQLWDHTGYAGWLVLHSLCPGAGVTDRGGPGQVPTQASLVPAGQAGSDLEEA